MKRPPRARGGAPRRHLERRRRRRRAPRRAASSAGRRRVATVLADTGERYFSMAEWFAAPAGAR